MAAVSTLLHAFLCTSALAASGYALYVGRSNERDGDYEAMCDIGPQMSCSSVLTSRRDICCDTSAKIFLLQIRQRVRTDRRLIGR